MKSAADTGSISRRRRPRVRRWMRARRRRSHHSSSAAPGVKRPRSAMPSLSSARAPPRPRSGRRPRRRGEVGRRDRPGARDPAAHRSPSSAALLVERSGEPGRRLRAPCRSAAPGSAARATRLRSALTTAGALVAVGCRPARDRRAARRDQLVEPRLPGGAIVAVRQPDEALERVVQLVGVAHVGPGLRAHLVDRRLVERADAAAPGSRIGAAQRRRRGRGAPRAARRRGTRRGWRSGSRAPSATAPAVSTRRVRISPASMRVEHGAQAVDVHRLVQAVVDGLVDQRMVGQLDRARCGCRRSRAAPGRPPPAGPRRACAGCIGHPLAAAVKRSSASARVAFQRQRVPNIGAASAACTRSSSRRCGPHHAGTRSSSGKLCCSPSESTMPSSVAAACSSKSKLTQKRLRSARPQARLMRAAERRVQHELHAAALVEEALGDDASSQVGTVPSTAMVLGDVGDELRRRRRRRGRTRAARQRRSRSAAVAERGRRSRWRRSRDRLATARACAPAPRRARTGSSAARPRVLDADPAGLDAADAPRVVAEQEDVAAHALDREVLVDLADVGVGRVLDDVVVGGVGDGAAAGDGGEPGAAAGAHAAVHAVAVQVRRAPAAAGGDALGEHLQHLVELRARGRGTGRRGAPGRTSVLGADLLGGGGRDHLLRQDVERLRRRAGCGRARPARIARTAAARLHQLVAREREEDALRHAAEPVARAADALQQRRERARRAEVADQVDVADVDAELERRGRDHDRHLARS